MALKSHDSSCVCTVVLLIIVLIYLISYLDLYVFLHVMVFSQVDIPTLLCFKAVCPTAKTNSTPHNQRSLISPYTPTISNRYNFSYSFCTHCPFFFTCHSTFFDVDIRQIVRYQIFSALPPTLSIFISLFLAFQHSPARSFCWWLLVHNNDTVCFSLNLSIRAFLF